MSVTIIINNQALMASGQPTRKDEEFFCSLRLAALQHEKDGRPISYKRPVPVPPKPTLRSV